MAIAALMLLALPNVLQAEEKLTVARKTTWADLFSDVIGHYPLPSATAVDSTAELNKKKSTLSIPKNWEFDFDVRRYIVSHNSYEYGSNEEPYTTPLSRLEFPMNTWWLDFTLRRTCPRWSIGSKLGFNISRVSDGVMKDSDWTTIGPINALALYSEGDLRVDKGFSCRSDIDFNVSDWLRLPEWLEVRPLFAFQYQRTDVTTYDGTQWEWYDMHLDEDSAPSDAPSSSMYGDFIRFKQDWYIYQIGARMVCNFPKMCKNLAISLHTESDWGPVYGYNEDFHLQRKGNLISHMASRGNSLYFLCGADMVISNTVKLGLDIDYLWIRTTGVIRDENHPLGMDYTSRKGVYSWSDQLSLIGHVSYAF